MPNPLSAKELGAIIENGSRHLDDFFVERAMSFSSLEHILEQRGGKIQLILIIYF
jgi:hypothetical protein